MVNAMVNAWWLIAVCFLWVVLVGWTNRMSYRHGIWDGAFNHFLPRVRQEMLYYDKFQAERIFAQEKGVNSDDKGINSDDRKDKDRSSCESR